jgi:phosphatidate cytidylyltransferase
VAQREGRGVPPASPSDTPLVPVSPPPGRSLAQAVITALVLLAIIIVFNLIGEDGFFFLAAVVVSIALFELLDMLDQSGHRPSIAFGVACGIALMSVAYWAREDIRGDALLLVLAVDVYGSFLLALRKKRGKSPATDAAWSVFGVIWIAGGGAAAVSILRLSDQGALLLTAYVLITALDDIGGYFAGTTFGKHKMAPSISPAKSWEGWLGGMVASLLGGALFGWMLSDLNVLQGLGLALISSLLAPAGDLSESVVKRQLGVKDSGRLLPGHGGLLDRLDAIVFCAPAAYVFLRFVVF